MWNCQDATFEFNIQSWLKNKYMNSKKCPTKREILSFAMSIYDPIGFTTPFTVRGNIILQKVWRYGVGWDKELNGSELTK